MKKVFMLSCLIFSLIVVHAQEEDENQAMNEYIHALMSKMTLEEKLGQLNLPVSGDIVTGQAKNSDVAAKIRAGKVGGLFNIKGQDKVREMQRIAVEESRLHIPLLFGMDVIHGYETVFPIPLGLAATWNMSAIEQSARLAAVEASADGICWTFSPMVDISRDPRWGRMAEGGGEDPYLGGRIAEAMVNGYQGKGKLRYKQDSNIMACVKHYALYGASEAGRDYNTVDMSRIRMFNEYMYPYKAAIEAGVGSVMASFNEVDGVPATANKWLLTDVLRKQWGFNGFVVTDYTGVSEMVDHGIGDLPTVSARALKAGVDMDMVSEGLQTLDEGKVSQEDIDRACRRVLEAKYKLGLFHDPYKYCKSAEAVKNIFTSEHRAIARKVAAESFVLLKNKENVLPLKRQGTIAVIGPLANSRSNMVGTWSVAADLDKPMTLIEGIRSVAGNNVRVVYAKGSHLMADEMNEKNATVFGRSLGREREKRTDEQMLAEALKIAGESDVIVAALGESSEMSGESSSRTDIGIPEVQKTLLRELLTTGKPVVLVLFSGRPMTIGWENENVPAILNVWFGGTEAAPAIGDVLFGDVNPSGKLPVTYPQNVGQIPLYYNHKSTGRPLAEGRWFEKFRSNYLDVSNDPLYPFGYGLSYGDVQVEKAEFAKAPEKEQDAEICVTVKNYSEVATRDVVEVYIKNQDSKYAPVNPALCGFAKVSLGAGEEKELTITVSKEAYKVVNDEGEKIFDSSSSVLFVGTNGPDKRSEALTGKMTKQLVINW